MKCEDLYSIEIRDLSKEETWLVASLNQVRSLAEVEEYLINYYNNLFDLAAYESQLKLDVL